MLEIKVYHRDGFLRKLLIKLKNKIKQHIHNYLWG